MKTTANIIEIAETEGWEWKLDEEPAMGERASYCWHSPDGAFHDRALFHEPDRKKEDFVHVLPDYFGNRDAICAAIQSRFDPEYNGDTMNFLDELAKILSQTGKPEGFIMARYSLIVADAAQLAEAFLAAIRRKKR